jgi:hypothetical protein
MANVLYIRDCIIAVDKAKQNNKIALVIGGSGEICIVTDKVTRTGWICPNSSTDLICTSAVKKLCQCCTLLLEENIRERFQCMRMSMYSPVAKLRGGAGRREPE